MIKLTNETLADLQEACSQVAHDNWDGSVTVEQSDEGVLTFTSFNEDGEVEARYSADWFGDVQGHVLYQFTNRFEGDKPVVLTLVPVAIVGLLGL
jgi:hypothetical protein